MRESSYENVPDCGVVFDHPYLRTVQRAPSKASVLTAELHHSAPTAVLARARAHAIGLRLAQLAKLHVMIVLGFVSVYAVKTVSPRFARLRCMRSHKHPSNFEHVSQRRAPRLTAVFKDRINLNRAKRGENLTKACDLELWPCSFRHKALHLKMRVLQMPRACQNAL